MVRRVSWSVVVLFVVGSIASQAHAKKSAPKPAEDAEAQDEIEREGQGERGKGKEKETEDVDEDEAASAKPTSKTASKTALTKVPASAAGGQEGKTGSRAGVGLPAAPPPIAIESDSGTSIRFGILVQPQFEGATSQANDINGRGYNLFLHRLRFMVGGTLLHKFDYFLSTDYPDLFKQVHTVDAMGSPVYLKNFPGMNMQDAFVTYRPVDWFKVDAGYMLPPMAHNAIQSAATLYGVDYFANTFLHKDAFGTTPSPRFFNPNANALGRDLGVQFRGLLFGGMVEYRAGLFQGRRALPGGAAGVAMPTAPGGQNFLRVAGRIQINLLDPETGFFYAGTYLGTKRVLSVGASGDFQGDYKYWAWDVLLDLPLGPGVLTAQANLAQWDPGTWLTTTPDYQSDLVKQRALMGEAGYLIAAIRLSPIVRLEQRWVASTLSGGAQSERRVGGGLAFWPYGHNSNLKIFYSQGTTNAPDTHAWNEFHLQWQVYFF